TRQDDDGAYQARYRLPGGEWSSWRHVVCGVKGHEQELRYLPGERRPAPAAGDALEVERLRRIAWLIGSIFVHGNFHAETFNERELEKLLRENGTFWDSLAQFDAALAAIAQQRKGGES
ncbi:MAG TPA: hypothetical protein DHL02_14810, partial [Achromobacter sp.]|nr:hypothetical protein [Achromobacter sp.]